MALLDRLRPQPAWKHPDPAMRVAAVEALPESDQAIVAAIAREDESPRVRRAALARLAELDVIATIAQSDADVQVRAEAAARLLTLAISAPEEPRAAQAAQAIADERHLAQIARGSVHESVALAALERLRDTRALGSTARNALHETVRMRALERVTDPAELEAIAVNTEHKDAGLGAVERLSDLTVLDSIGERARNKVVGRRAKAIVRDQQHRETEVREAIEARTRRQALLADAVDALERQRDVARGRAELARLGEDFAATGEAAPEIAARFAAATSRLAAHFDAIERHEAEAAEARSAREAALAARQALIERVAGVEGDEISDPLDALADEWATLPAVDGPEAAALDHAYREARTRLEGRAAARLRAVAVRDEIALLVAEAEQVAALEPADGRARWQAMVSRWTALTAGLDVEPALAERFAAASATWSAKDREALAARSRERDALRTRLEEVGARAAAIAAATDATLKDIDHAVRDLRLALEHPPSAFEGLEAIVVQLKGLQALLVPRLRELRDAEEWRRWANAGIQEELVKRMEALKSGTDIPEVARQVRDLRRQWKAVSAGPKDESDALWQRFKGAMDEVQARCDEHYGRVAAEQAANLATRLAITDAAEGLAQSTDWIPTAEALKRLQHEWNTAGPAPREQMAELARRFRTACDTFFTRRKHDLSERKQVWSVNAHKKEELCARAEALAASTDWQAALTEIKQLQAEWKAIGPVRKNRSETLWKRFRGACDTFFERYGRRHEIAQQQRAQEREHACEALEALAAQASPGGEAPEGLLAAVEAIWTRWHEAPGLSPELLNPLRARVDAALDALLTAYPSTFTGSRFDQAAAAARREALVQDVESAVKGTVKEAQAGATPAATLAALLKESLAANTIGGRVNEDAKLRAAADRVRRAQQAWRDLGPAMGEAARALEARFQKAVRRFFDQHPDLRHAPAHGHGHGHGGGRPGGPPHRSGPRR